MKRVWYASKTSALFLTILSLLISNPRNYLLTRGTLTVLSKMTRKMAKVPRKLLAKARLEIQVERKRATKRFYLCVTNLLLYKLANGTLTRRLSAVSSILT